MLDLLQVNFNIVSVKSFEDYSIKISNFNEEFFYDNLSKNNNFSNLNQTGKNAVRHNLLLHCYVGTIEKINNHFRIKQESKLYFDSIKTQKIEKSRELLRDLILKSPSFNPIIQYFSINPSKISKDDFRQFLMNTDDKPKSKYRYDTASNVIITFLGRLNLINYGGKRGKKSKIRVRRLSEFDNYVPQSINFNLKDHLIKIGLNKEDIANMIVSLDKEKQKLIIEEIL